MISSVRWFGLTQMALDLGKGMPDRLGRGVNQYTKNLLETTHTLYVENLSGGSPSTTERPLPVGMRSGTLKAGARKVQRNQYSGEVLNDVPYAGWIEVGTCKMAPRRPLGDAVDRVREMIPGELAQVMTTVVKTE